MSENTIISRELTAAVRECLGIFERDASMGENVLAGLKQSVSFRDITFPDEIAGFNFTVQETTWLGDVPSDDYSELQEIDAQYNDDRHLRIACFPLDDVVIVVDDGSPEALGPDEVETFIDIMRGAANRHKRKLEQVFIDIESAIIARYNRSDTSRKQIDLPGYDFINDLTTNMEVYEDKNALFCRLEIERDSYNSAYYLRVNDRKLYYYENDDDVDNQMYCTYDVQKVEEFSRLCYASLEQ